MKKSYLFLCLFVLIFTGCSKEYGSVKVKDISVKSAIKVDANVVTTDKETTATTTTNTTTTTTDKETTTTTTTTDKETTTNTATTVNDIFTTTEEQLTIVEETTEYAKEVINNVQISSISVNCLKVTWDAIDGVDYTATVASEAPYQENIYYYYKDKGLLYITALRENSEYTVTLTPSIDSIEPATVTGHTETVDVVYNFDEDEEAYAQYKDSGVFYATDFYAGERASGLTSQPASGAIAGSIKDPIYGTTIRMDEYGDFCVAMGTFFGHDWDRYLITLQNGQQFTVKQCDDKGSKWYHAIGGNDTNRNIIEFIYDSDANVPSGVWATGTWGSFFWNGISFDHIASIQKINYPDTIVSY